MNGIVLLREGTVLSGDTFLKADPDSRLSVYAFKSSIVGNSQIGKDASARLYLSNESGWYLAKSNNRNLRQISTGGEQSTGKVIDKRCEGSYISFVSLENSTIAFLPPRDENEGYQTLHIGEEEGVVYSASGDSKIYVNASFVSDDSNNVKLLSDQLLIYGNVTGKTKVYVNDSSVINTLNGKLRNGEQVQRQTIQNQADQRENRSVPKPISIVQVFGEASSDSFELANTYVTLQGSPYQYILRANSLQYSLPSGGTEKLWNFNLESKLESGADGSVNSPVSKVQPNASGTPTLESGASAPDAGRSASQGGNLASQGGTTPTLEPSRSASELDVQTSQAGGSTPQAGGSTPQAGGSTLQGVNPGSEPGTPVSEPNTPASKPSGPTPQAGNLAPQAGSPAPEASGPSLSQTGSLEKDNVDLSNLVVSKTRGSSGYTLSLSPGTPTSDEERYGNMVVTKDGVDIVLLGQTGDVSYELGTDILEYSITDGNGDLITFDSSYDSISVIKNASTVDPLSTPTGTDGTTLSQSNEESEDVRTITHERTEVPEASESGISTSEFDTSASDAGSLASQDGNQASQGSSSTYGIDDSTSELDSFTYDVDTPTSELGTLASEVGESSGHTLSLSSGIITSDGDGYGDDGDGYGDDEDGYGDDEEGDGDLVATEDGVDIVLLGQTDNDSYELGANTVEYNITDENGESITFDSSSDSISVTENASTVTPLSTPTTTDVTTPSQSNERSENVRTITHEGTGVSEAGATPSVVSPSVSIVPKQKESLVNPVLNASVGSKPSETVTVTESKKTVSQGSLPSVVNSTGSTKPTAGSKQSISAKPMASSVGSKSSGTVTVTESKKTVSQGSLPSVVNSTGSTKPTAGSKQSISAKPMASSVGSKSSETVTVTESKKTASTVSLPSVVKPTDSTKSTAGSKRPISVKPVVYKESRVPAVADVSSAGKKGTSVGCNGIGGTGQSQSSILCSDGKSYTVQQLTLKANNSTQHSMHVKSGTNIKLNAATIIGPNSGNGNAIDLAKVSSVSAVLAEEDAEVVLENKSVIQSSVIGLEAQSGGKVKMTGGTVDALYVGALAGSGSSVNLKDTKINVTGDLAAAGLVSLAGKVSMDSGAITLTKGVAVRSEAGGSVELDKVDITAKKGQGKLDSADNFGRAAFLLSDNASVDFKNGNVVTDAHALWIMKSDDNVVETGSSRRRRSSEVRPTTNHANIESSIVRVEGDGTYGIYFDGLIQKEASQQNRSKDLATEKAIVVKRSTVSKQEKTPISITGTVSLKKTDFEVASGIAIYGNNSGGHVSLENKTTLVGDLLLKADNDSNISVLVDSSIVKGDVRVDKSSYAKLDLINQSEWILERSAQRNLGTPDLGCVDSCISSVSLVNSTIDFASSESEGKYQTLHIGNGKGIVYAAQGNAAIHLNARLNPRDPSNQQVTDRLVIHGDVSGKTKIHVRGDAGNVGDGKANAKIAHTVSIIQVYGQAKKDSFQLDGNYVALRNSPYKYTLRAYGPEATSKQEHVQQKFVKDGGEFWNFRLENQYVKSMGSAALPEKFVRSVVPQVPTYLILPNSVFHAGLMDISNQNKQLDTLRMTSNGMVEVRENPALYLRGYSGNYRYASDLSTLEYGYGGDLDYHGVEAGVLLQTIESSDSTISFGVMGTYGKLSLQPLNVEQSKKSAFDKWTATVYGSVQHNVGFYVDGLLSYGLFKGDVLTLARGKTATLKGNPLSVSLTGGQTIETGYKGFVFDPQVQVVYQHLQFNKARDIDNFNIEMGNLDQWVARVGGRLTKTPTGSEGVNAVSFYGKLYLAHGFEGKQPVHFKDAFKLGAFGSSLEAGLGFNAKLLPQFSLHADILYQHKLNKAGFSGASFSGGIRYQF
ncbi:autotransporter outer membrane beta-barrel domain-containing protein [Bartonella sp. PS17NMGDW]|uniref:autotransporter outer membrane beta-barrel domain-containing protein n=1 Tax=Bartonella sp. PS17NMGDW TaxID=3243573 RepID=UPI0035CF2F1E